MGPPKLWDRGLRLAIYCVMGPLHSVSFLNYRVIGVHFLELCRVNSIVKRDAEFNLHASVKTFFSNLLKTLSERDAHPGDNGTIYVPNVNLR